MESDSNKPSGSADAGGKENNTEASGIAAEAKARPEALGPGKAATTGSSPSKPPAKKKTSRMGCLFVLLIVVAMAAGGYYAHIQGWWNWRDLLTENKLNTGGAPESGETAASGEPSQGRPSPADAAPGENPESAIGEPVAPPDDYAEVLATGQAERIDGLEGTVASMEAQLADLQLQVNNQKQRIRELSTTSREDWLLAEAEYLLRLANQRLLTERRSANALSLMENADAILRDLNDPDLFAVRKALARDITEVKMAGVVDREGIFVRLESLVASVGELHIPLRSESVSEPMADGAPQQHWYQRLWANIKTALIKMSGIVRIETVATAPQRVPLPSEQEAVRQSLRMNLEQAQLALMREEQALYDASLTRAGELVRDNFAQTRAAGVFAEEIGTLKGEDITQSLPQLKGSINALQDYTRLWHNTYTAAPSGDSTPGAETGAGEDQ